MKVLFMNDSTTQSNWGGRAATTSLRMMIRHSGGNIVRTITIDDLVRSSLDHHAAAEDANQLNSREIVKLFLPPVLLKLRRRLAPGVGGPRENPLIPRTWGDYDRSVERVLGKETPWPELLRSFYDMDVAVVFGDGDIYGNGILPRTLLFLSFLIKKHFNKPVIMVNHSADFEHPDLLMAAEEVYPLFDDVVFRDQVSAERCKTLCAGRFAADTAFSFKPASRKTWTPVAGRPSYFDVWPDTASFDPSEPYLCVGGSSIFGHSGNEETIISGYILLIQHLQSLYSGQIVLTASDWVDQSIFRAIAERAGLPLVGLTAPVQQVVDILGNADAYIGGRWHPSIFALRGGTPVLALSSMTFKMRALTDMAGLSSATFDALGLEHEMSAIGQQLLSYLEQGDDLRSRLCSWADEMAENSWDNVAYLDRLQTSTGVIRSAGA
jgi:polysaccharide pyruvyl transferase WcaK-like protein